MRSSLSPIALCASLCFAGAAFAQQPPAPPPGVLGNPAGAAAPLPPGVPPGRPLQPPDAVQQGAAPAVSGRLQRWLVNPDGRVDGFLLADGTQVNLPPHLSATVLQAVKPGDTVQVQGWRAPNAPVLRAVRLTAGGRTVEDTPPAVGSPPPVPPRSEPAALAAMSASGRVARLLYTPRGDANGVLLDSGAIVRFPPHVGAGLASSLQPGSTLFARGWGSRSPQGEALEATAMGSSAETARELFAGPGVEPPLPGPRGAQPPKGPKSHHHRGPDAGPAVRAGMPPGALPAAPMAPPGALAPPARSTPPSQPVS